MNYDFDALIDRRNTNSLKYDFAARYGKPEDTLPLWVADMDFLAPPEVLADIERAVSHGIFGYTEARDDYYEAVTHWFSSRFGFAFEQSSIIKSPGVVFALAQTVRAFTQPGDSVIVQTPVYYPFFEVIHDNARRIVRNPLIYENGAYTIDFADFEKKAASEQVKLFIMCSPHNPVGRVWTRDELTQLHAICMRHNILVVSDEIHCDFVWPGHAHTCFGLLNDDAVIITAPSKTFNLAGLQASNVIAKNGELRRRLTAEFKKTGYSQLNTLAITATRSAYTHGEKWLGDLKTYLAGNIRFTRNFLNEHLPRVRLAEPQGTYLLWLDFSAYRLTQAELNRRITEGAGLWLDGGTMFGAEGEGFQRINVACPREKLADALRRLANEFEP